MSETRDPGTLDDILPAVRDSRDNVSWEAIKDLSAYDDQRALDVIAETLPSTNNADFAYYAMDQFQHSFPTHDISAQMGPALLAGSLNSAISGDTRIEMAGHIADTQMQMQAWENILLTPSRYNPVKCQIEAAAGLEGMKSAAAGGGARAGKSVKRSRLRFPRSARRRCAKSAPRQ